MIEPNTRTAVILAAVKRQLELRKALLDSAGDLGEVTITVQLEAGTSVVRSTSFTEKNIARRI